MKMQYLVESVTKTSEQEMLKFLKEHENYSLFLLSNFESYGAKLSSAPYSGNFKLIRLQTEVVGVFCLTQTGNLLVETTMREPVFNVILDACNQEPISLKGVVGNWDFCKPFWEHLKKTKVVVEEGFAAKEILYSIDLCEMNISNQANVRLLTAADYTQYKPMRLDYLMEEGIPNDLTDQQLFDFFLEKTKEKIIWGFFLNDTLVSVADLNAKALDLGQVGGVYTKPHFRKKGYSKSVMKQLLRDAKELHKIRKLIIFTADKNTPAQNLYISLGVQRIGNFALLFSK